MSQEMKERLGLAHWQKNEQVLLHTYRENQVFKGIVNLLLTFNDQELDRFQSFLIAEQLSTDQEISLLQGLIRKRMETSDEFKLLISDISKLDDSQVENLLDSLVAEQ